MHKRHVLIRNALLVHVRMKQRTIVNIYVLIPIFLVPGQPNTGEGPGDTGTMNMYLMLAIWLAIAFLLFIFRPRTIRNNREPLGKRDNQVNRMKNV